MINNDNFHLPSKHPGLYVTRSNNVYDKKTNKEKSEEKSLSTALSRTKNTNNNCWHVNAISTRECEHHIQRQLKNDHELTSKYAAARITKENKMSIIIKKKQTHHDLARYLHAACFAPVPSTWKQAIKNKKFIT